MFQNGLNALHLASKEGHVNIVTELLQRGANVDAATKVIIGHFYSVSYQQDYRTPVVSYVGHINVISCVMYTTLYSKTNSKSEVFLE